MGYQTQRSQRLQCRRSIWRYKKYRIVSSASYPYSSRLRAYSKSFSPLLKSSTRKARLTSWRLVLSCHSQFFQSLRHFSSQAKERSTTHRCGITAPKVGASRRRCAAHYAWQLLPRRPVFQSHPPQRVGRYNRHRQGHSSRPIMSFCAL